MTESTASPSGSSHVDVLIIGSGISALTSAALLAKKGKSVLVLELHTKPGGYMHSFKRFGVTFDSGAHYFGSLDKGQPFRILLEYLGIMNDASFNETFIELDPSGFDVFKFPDGDIAMPRGYENTISELSAIFPNERHAIETYFGEVKRVVQLFPTYAFDDETDPEAAMIPLETPLKSFVEKLTSNPRLQSVFYSYCNLHGVFPQDTPFGFHAIVTDSLIQGAYGMVESGDALTQRFIKRIEALGGRVLTKHRVTQLTLKDRQVHEVVCENGARFTADWIISTIHPKQTMRLLEHTRDFSPAFRDRVTNLRESPPIFGVYAKTQGSSKLNPLRNYYYFKSSDPRSMFERFGPNDEPTVVFASTAERVWKPGEALPVSLLSPSEFEWFMPYSDQKYGKRSDEYKAFKEKLAAQSLSLVRKYDSELIDGIQAQVTSTALTNLHYGGPEEGSAYGIYHSIQNTGGRALGPRTKISNLLLAGQNYVFPGLLGAAISGLRTSAHIVGFKPVLKELKALRV